MGSRLELQSELERILGSENVYFQPPETLKISYPCIIYHLEPLDPLRADNGVYKLEKSYQVTLIHKSPENPIYEKIASLPKCRMTATFTKDNLNHYVYRLYY